MMKDNLKEEIEAATEAQIPMGVVVVPEEDDRETRLKERVDFYIENFKTMTEKEFREMEPYDEPRTRTPEDLTAIIDALVERGHDYGTCVYAMAHAAQAAFNYVAYKLGVTGFQAGAANMTFMGRVRNMEDGFRILDYNKLLFPQYFNNPEHFPTAHQLLMKNIESLSKKAGEWLDEKDSAHPNVREHWEWVRSLDSKVIKSE